VLDEGIGPTSEMFCTPIVQKKMPMSIIILVQCLKWQTQDRVPVTDARIGTQIIEVIFMVTCILVWFVKTGVFL
jgi:hypothetical protein